MQETVDNLNLFNQGWGTWTDMKEYGPASRFLRTIVREVLERHVRAGDVSRVLDFGCGEGRLSFEIASIFPKARVLGTDMSQTGIEFAAKAFPRDNLSFACDLESSSLKDRYDLVTCFEVLEHIEDWKPVADGLANATNRYLLVSVPTGRMRPFETAMGHYRNFQQGELEGFFAERGLKPREIYYSGFPFYSPIYRDLCDRFHIGTGAIGRGTYTWKTKLACWIVFTLFNTFSTRRKLGDQFCGLFEKAS